MAQLQHNMWTGLTARLHFPARKGPRSTPSSPGVFRRGSSSI
jgi:hypothetical protein